MSAAPPYGISALAQEFGVTARTLRFYEDRGLITPRRRGTARLYSARDRARLTLILRGKRLGFSLANIKEMLDLYDADPGHLGQLRAALEHGRRRIAALEGQRRDIDAALAELRQLEAEIVRRLADKEGLAS